MKTNRLVWALALAGGCLTGLTAWLGHGAPQPSGTAMAAETAPVEDEVPDEEGVAEDDDEYGDEEYGDEDADFGGDGSGDEEGAEGIEGIDEPEDDYLDEDYDEYGEDDDPDADEGFDDKDRAVRFGDMTLAQLREYQAFVYVSSGRDPMTFRVYVAPRVRQIVTTSEAPATPTQSGPTDDEKEAMLDEHLLTMEAQLAQFAYADAIKTAEEAAELAHSWGGVTPEKPALWQRFELIKTYHGMAERMMQADAIRKEFLKVKIDLTGIFWSPRAATAVINMRVVEPGQALESSPQDNPVVVEEIHEDGVVLSYRNYRFWKALHDD